MISSELTALLEQMVAQGASDLFLSVSAPALIKVQGKFVALEGGKLDGQQVHALCYSVLNDEQRRTYEATRELNMSLQVKHLGRFRLNLFRQKGEIALVARHINGFIPSLRDLDLPDILENLIMEDRGLILLVGGTGTGKSTTLASMIDYRNSRRGGHILTIEDPVEFIHEHKRSLVNQREVGLDTDSYAIALKNAMREAPDVIMIGEVRDMETMKHALAYAETGHLCLTTLHANNANQAIERILNFFPDMAHAQVLQDMSIHLRAIVSQRLTQGVDGKRVPAVEVMLNTPYISELIRFGKTEKLKEAMIQATELGCKTLDDSLYDLVLAGKISQDEALRHADSRTNLALRFKLEGAAFELGTGSSVSGIKKNVTYAKQVNFSGYRSFRVHCSRFNGPRAELREQIDGGLRRVMEFKGFRHQGEDPDLEVQYAFGTETVQMEVEAITDRFGRTDDMPVTETQRQTLVINMFDRHLGRPVWKVTATSLMAEGERAHEQVNRDLVEVLDGFPPN